MVVLAAPLGLSGAGEVERAGSKEGACSERTQRSHGPSHEASESGSRQPLRAPRRANGSRCPKRERMRDEDPHERLDELLGFVHGLLHPFGVLQDSLKALAARGVFSRYMKL